MGIYLNPGNEAFRMAVNSDIYVDKTMLLAETNKMLNKENRFVAVSRPRRFGKSMAANMLVAYYGKDCDSSDIFSKYKISRSDNYREHLNQYNVIKINMQEFMSNSSNVNEMIHELEYEIIDELKSTYNGVVADRIERLSRVLDRIYASTQEKFIFVIDEWDCIMRENKEKNEEQKKYLDFLRNFLKDKSYVALAYMTGILPIKKYGSHSALNMFTEYSMIDQDCFAEFTGFTEEEVLQLTKQYDFDFEKLKEWYNGYYMEKAGPVYNPRSVVSALSRRKTGSYWTRTETYEALKIHIDLNLDGLKDAIICMLSDERVRIVTERFQNDMTTLNTRDDVLTLLVHLGYLAFDSETSEVYIPNYEVKCEFENAMIGDNWSEVVTAIQKSQKLLEDTWNMNCEEVAKSLDVTHGEFTSILKYNDENSLTCVLSMAYYNAVNYYTKVYEMPTGKGFADIALIPKKNVDKPALVIELKCDKPASSAMEQMRDRKYAEGLKEYQGNMLLVGISYDKETKKHTCQIEKWN